MEVSGIKYHGNPSSWGRVDACR